MVGKILLLMGPKLMVGTADLSVCPSPSLTAQGSLAREKRGPSVCLMSTHCFWKRQTNDMLLDCCKRCWCCVLFVVNITLYWRWINDVQFGFIHLCLLSLKLSRGRRRGKNEWIWWGQTYCWGQGMQNSEIPRCGMFSCHSESSGILRIQDELVMHPYCLVCSRQSHSRDKWGLMV